MRPPVRPRKIRVILTSSHQRFVPRVPAGAHLVGVVERGMQIGALARLGDGAYVQINGDVVQPLNRSQVEAALQEARTFTRRREVSTPVVTVKPRRRMVPDDR